MMKSATFLHADPNREPEHECNHLCCQALMGDQKTLATAIFKNIMPKANKQIQELLLRKYANILSSDLPTKEDEETPLWVEEEEKKEEPGPVERDSCEQKTYHVGPTVSNVRKKVDKIKEDLGLRWFTHNNIQELHSQQNSLEALLKENPESWKNTFEAVVQESFSWLSSAISSFWE